MSERLARLFVQALIHISVIGLIFPETVIVSAVALFMSIIEPFT